MSQSTTKPIITLVKPEKTEICLCIWEVWSQSSLIACAFYSLLPKGDEWDPLPYWVDVQADLSHCTGLIVDLSCTGSYICKIFFLVQWHVSHCGSFKGEKEQKDIQRKEREKHRISLYTNKQFNACKHVKFGLCFYCLLYTLKDVHLRLCDAWFSHAMPYYLLNVI